jgi:hypothetical protein
MDASLDSTDAKTTVSWAVIIIIITARDSAHWDKLG